MAGLLQQAGAPPNRNAKFVPLFMDRAFTGLYTQRSPLRDPSDWATSKFYGGRPDALLDGSNIELTNRLTLQRRPGLTQLSTATYPTPPNRAFSFELTDGTIRLIIDTDSTGSLAVTSADAVSGGTTTYHGTFPTGGGDAFVGMIFTFAGFVNAQNNGSFVVTGSTTTTITVANTQGIAETIAATAVSSGAVYYDHQNGVKEVLFGKAAGAGQTHFVAVAGVLYMGDGVEVKKYTPNNTNGTIWNWGITAPTTPPSLHIVSAGSASVLWQANTWFSTMGILLDSNGNLQQLVSVNADGTNPNGVFGLSSVGGPAWNHTIGGDTTDGTVTWRTVGTLLPWAATTTYTDYGKMIVTPEPDSVSIFDIASNSIFYMTSLADFETTGPPNTKPNFNGVNGAKFPVIQADGQQHNQSNWTNIGGAGFNPLWQGGTFYGMGVSVVEQPMPPLPGQTAYIHVAIVAGTSDVSFASPNWETSKGAVTIDNQLAWVCLGTATWAAGTQYAAWVNAQDHSFDAVVDTNGNFQVCVTSGTSGGSNPNWATDYGSHTQDGSVIWVNVGASNGWHQSKAYCLPTIGFSAPSDTNPYGGVAIKDSNGNTQYCIQTGLSGAVQPVWDTDIGDLTADNEILWINNGPPPAQSLSWSKSISYVYSFKARTATDSYNTTAPPLWPNPLGAYLGSGTGAISSASPAVTVSTGNAGAVVTVSGVGSLDPQVDTIEIYRTTDGGATYLFLTDIPNPQSVGGNPGTWSLNDYMPDSATSTLPGLNPLIMAPVNDVNNPPNAAFLPMAYNYQRIWGAVGSSVFWSGGPDTLVGNPNEAFDAADTFPYLASVVRLVKTTRGLVVFLPNSIELIAGGPSTASFFSVTLAPGVGLKSYNALDVYAGEIFFFSADSQFKVISPELQLADFGFPIGDKLHTWDSSKVYVAVLQAGLDSAIFLADGSTGWYRLNPRQVPGGFSGPEPIWSPFANLVNGGKMVQTVETQPGTIQLLVGDNDGGQKILVRDLNVFTDDGQTYDAWYTMGSVMLANPGQIAVLKFIEADFSGVDFHPAVSVLMNEISGSFTQLLNPVFDPPSIYGRTIKPTSYSPNRYYFSSVRHIARCRHMQIKVDFGATSNGDEMYNLTIFGRLVVEP